MIDWSEHFLTAKKCLSTAEAAAVSGHKAQELAAILEAIEALRAWKAWLVAE